jgi:toxin FitB
VKRAIVDTNVVINGVRVRPDLDFETAVSSITYAELHVGVLLAKDDDSRAVRLKLLSAARQTYGPGLPFDDAAAINHAQVDAAVRAAGRSPNSRAKDLMIAATARAQGAAVVTFNTGDFVGLEGIVEIIDARTITA